MKIENMSVEQLYKHLKPVIVNIYKEYGYVFSEDDYQMFIRKILTRIKLSEKYVLIDNFESYLNNFLNSSVKEKLNDDSGCIYVINQYINFKMKPTTTYRGCLKEFQKLTDLFDKFDFRPDLKTIEEIIKINSLLNCVLQTIVEKNKKIIKTRSLNIIFGDNLLEMFVETYCVSNNLEILNDNEGLEVGTFDDSEDLLIDDEEKSLIQEIQVGNSEIRNIFVEKNMGLVKMVAQKYCHRGLPFEDLMQEGCIGLLKAINRYDLSKGCKFSTYAIWQIRASIIRAIEDTSRIVRVPNNVYQQIGKYSNVKQKLSKENFIEPTVEDIAKVLGISIEKAYELEQNNAPVTSLNKLYENEDSQSSLEDFLPSVASVEEDVIISERNRLLYQVLGECNVSKRDFAITLLMHGVYGKIPKLEDLAKVYNITNERVRQIVEETLDKFRRSKYAESFIVYMDNPNQALENLQRYRLEIVQNGIGKKKSF